MTRVYLLFAVLAVVSVGAVGSSVSAQSTDDDPDRLHRVDVAALPDNATDTWVQGDRLCAVVGDAVWCEPLHVVNVSPEPLLLIDAFGDLTCRYEEYILLPEACAFFIDSAEAFWFPVPTTAPVTVPTTAPVPLPHVTAADIVFTG